MRGPSAASFGGGGEPDERGAEGFTGTVEAGGPVSGGGALPGHAPSRHDRDVVPGVDVGVGRGSQRRHGMVAVVVTVAIGMFISVLDSAIVGVAYPAIEKDLGATSESVQWITTAYKLCQGVVIPAAVWLCIRYGLSRMYWFSLVMYAVSSALCASATNIVSLVAFRILQAIPGALTPIVCIGIVYKLVPPKRLPIALGIYAMIAISAPGFAPFIGGCLVEYVSWRAIFLASVPLAIIGIAGAHLLLPTMSGSKRRPFDFLGFTCAAVGFFALLLAISKGPQWGWTSYSILVLLALGSNALALFVLVELRVTDPLLNMRIFTYAPFVIAIVILEVTFTGLTAILSFLPVFLQQAQLMTPSQAGFVFIPQALAWIASIPLAGLLWETLGARRVTIVGLLVMGVATIGLSRLNVDLPRLDVMLILTARAAGLGLVMIPMLGGAVSALPPHLLPDGIAFRTMIQRCGASLGLALLSVVVTIQRAQHFADQSALLDVSKPHHITRISQMQEQGPGGLLPLWENLQARGLTAAYSQIYLVVGAITLGSIALALAGRWAALPRGSEDLVEVGA
jgi:EmrB/QacA subfamily drug resistance transporter